MEEKKEGIEKALADYMEGPMSLSEECETFARTFGSHLGTLKKLRAQNYIAGKLPVEVENPSIMPGEINTLLEDFTSGRMAMPCGAGSRLLPFISVGHPDRRVHLKILEYGTQQGPAPAEIREGLETMEEAVRFFNSAADKRQKYPRVYEYIKTLTGYLGGRQEHDTDAQMIGDFLEAACLDAPESFTAPVYSRTFHEPNIQGMLKFIYGGKPAAIDGRGFKRWLEEFRCDNKGFMLCAGRMRKIAEENIRAAFKKRFLAELGTFFPKQPAGPFRTAPSLQPPAVISMRPLPLKRVVDGPADLDKIRLDAKERTKTVTAVSDEKAAPAETGPLVGYRIIDIGDVFDGLTAEFFVYMREQAALGAAFESRQLLIICDLLFGDPNRWIVAKKIKLYPGDEAGLKKAFENHPKSADEDVIFVNRLYELRETLLESALLNESKIKDTRGKFIREMRKLNAKKDAGQH